MMVENPPLGFFMMFPLGILAVVFWMGSNSEAARKWDAEKYDENGERIE